MSKRGAALALSYGLLALGFLICGLTCRTFLCGIVVVVPALPWWLLMGDFGSNPAGIREVIFPGTALAMYGPNAMICYLGCYEHFCNVQR